MKCEMCGKPSKENTGGNKRYCQGHSILSVAAFEDRLEEARQQTVNRNIRGTHMFKIKGGANDKKG